MNSHKESPAQPVVISYPSGFNLQREEVDLREIWQVLWRQKWIIIAISALFAVAGVVVALSLPNIYRAEAVLAPSEEAQGGGMARMAGQIGGLASLAGLDLQGADGTNKVAVAIEVLKSRQFIGDFVEKHGILPELMAVKGWQEETNQLVYDRDIYNPESDTWLREVDPPRTPTPSLWQAHKAFSEILTVSTNSENGFVTIAVEHHSPHIAQQWTSLLVDEINRVMKEQDVGEAQRSIEFLNQQLEQVALADMRRVFYQLIEEQIQTVMLAEVRAEYIFSTIDPAMVPEERDRPNRALICILFVIAGGLLAVIAVLSYHYLFATTPEQDKKDGA